MINRRRTPLRPTGQRRMFPPGGALSPKLILTATGSEVSMALQAQGLLTSVSAPGLIVMREFGLSAYRRDGEGAI